jgi:YbbR domain-containing protein
MPAFIPLDLVPIITQTIPVQVQLTNQSGLSTAYEVAGQPTTRPSNAIIQGAAPLVALVATVEATLPINGVSASFRETRTLVAVDKNGNTIEGITIEPAEVEVQLWVVRRSDALDVGVRAMTTEAPPDGYWLSGLQVSPPSITLRGEPARLAEMGGFVDTLPIDLSLAFGTLTVQIPLDLPADIQAVDNAGNVITNVTVEAQVSARTGDILLTRPVEILTPDSEDVIIVPESVELLLSGPLPLLNEIEANPELLRVTLTTTGIRVGESEEREPQVIAPEGITVQLVQPTILVTKELN